MKVEIREMLKGEMWKEFGRKGLRKVAAGPAVPRSSGVTSSPTSALQTRFLQFSKIIRFSQAIGIGAGCAGKWWSQENR